MNHLNCAGPDDDPKEVLWGVVANCDGSRVVRYLEAISEAVAEDLFLWWAHGKYEVVKILDIEVVM